METRISIFSGLSSSLSLSFRTSSSSSVCGQGTLSAKFIKALGSLVLRGSDKLIIQRRLSNISAQVASHTSGQESVAMYGRYSLSPYPIFSSPVSNKSEQWGDILELSRRGLYTDEIRRQALNRIMMQLETGDFYPLVEVLVKWKPIEVSIFLFELMSCLPDERLNALTLHQSALQESIRAEYAASSVIRKEQITRALIRAIKLLLLAGKEAAETVISAGFLTVILLMVAAEGLQVVLPSSTSKIPKVQTFAGPSLTLWECKEALAVLALYEDADFSSRLAPWPFTLFWPKAKDFDLPECFLVSLESTRAALPGPESPLISEAWRLRLSGINTVFSFRPPPGHGYNPGRHVRTALTELLWLLRHSESDPALELEATLSLLKFIGLGPKRWRILGALLADCSYENMTMVFRKLVSVLQTSSSSKDLLDEYRKLLPSNRKNNPGDYFLEFCTNISRDFPVLIKPLSESGIASLLLSILSDIDPTRTFQPPTNSSQASQKQLIRDVMSRLPTVIPSPGQHLHNRDKSLRILDVGIAISVSLSMMEDHTDSESDLWERATKNRLRPILSSALRDIWTLLACQARRLSRSRENDDGPQAGGEERGQAEADVRRLLICFQALAVFFEVDVYSTA